MARLTFWERNHNILCEFLQVLTAHLLYDITVQRLWNYDWFYAAFGVAIDCKFQDQLSKVSTVQTSLKLKIWEFKNYSSNFGAQCAGTGENITQGSFILDPPFWKGSLNFKLKFGSLLNNLLGTLAAKTRRNCFSRNEFAKLSLEWSSIEPLKLRNWNLFQPMRTWVRLQRG